MSGREADVGRPPLLPSPGASPEAIAERPEQGIRRELKVFGTIVIVGGGCYGSYYLRQLQRAAAAGAVTWQRLLVIDRDPSCRVVADAATTAKESPPGLPNHEVITGDWLGFFRSYLNAAASDPASARSDAIVPSPLMPHLMYDWLLDRARRRWPDRTVERRPLEVAPSVPWTRAGGDGTQYVSFAEWMCPINCIEPMRCPHTRGPRTWSMPPAIQAFVNHRRAAGHALHGPCVFHCTHRAYGVGMLDTREVLDADRLVALAGTSGAADVLVGTASHCHGALGLLSIGAPAT
jgi:hypothetical protein